MKKLNALFIVLSLGMTISVSSLVKGSSLITLSASKNTPTDTIGIGDSKKVDGNYIGGMHISTNNAIGYNIYNNVITKYTIKVASKDELLSVLKNAGKGSIIYIDDNAVIDLTNSKDIHIPDDVTLASGRGKQKGRGALIFTTLNGTLPLLDPGNHVRITGLRIQGPDTSIGKNAYAVPVSRGISSSGGSYITIDNCELYGWSHAAIFLFNGANHIYIHHNYFHNNQRTGLGYGVCLDKASALVKANVFNYGRHAVAGTGATGTSYEASYNLVLPNFIGHAFDMHGGIDRKDNTNIAGDSIKINHNTIFLRDYPGVWIRGIPTHTAYIQNNDFINLDSNKAIKQTDKIEAQFLNKNILMRNNRFSKK